MTTVRLQSRFLDSISPKNEKSLNLSSDILRLPLIALVAFIQFAALWGFFFNSPHSGAFHNSRSVDESMWAIENAYRC